ncbi:TonB-dependent receptor [Sphingomonas sp. BT-65]|uniref:TonB-dependent receptor n=1 Tax=Sphingomonas sp. BT-65 TaxID=2989821 RepID=UPI00223556C9|nr:TonB-dependent receptor [Sphingomonas sp. BT-65]MCW4460192.1 TonB-dependent receptor [Sphingomonas sp. BT-65]
MKLLQITKTDFVGRSRVRAAAAALAWTSGAAALAIGVSAPAHAQVSGASLRGTVKAEGGVSQVTAINVDTGFTRTSTVDADGGYQFASLPVGNYRLELTTPNGVRRTDEFKLNVAQNAVLDFDFSQPDIAEGAGDAIIITGSRIRSMQGGEVGRNISQRLIEQLPQTNRNFMSFADLAPGVQFVTNESDQTSLRGGAQGANSVNIFIDGIGQKDYVLKGGVTGQDSTQGNPFPQLAIGEYRVISSNYKAEFDQVSSVAITAVTKSGTNEFHGEAFFDFANQDLRDRLPSENFPRRIPKIKTRDMQFGGALGGPIIKDVLHFFGTYEGKRIIRARDVIPGLDLAPSYFPTEYQQYFGPQNETFNENLYFGKLNFTPTSRDLFEFSVKYRDETGEQFNTGINAYSTRGLAKVEEWRGLARWEHTADTWVNDLKVAYEDVSWSPRPVTFGNAFRFNATVPNTPPLTGTRRGDILVTGAGRNFQDKGQKGWQVSDDFTYTGFEGHTFKVGVKAKWITLNTNTQNGVNPIFTYNVNYNPGGGTFNDDIPYRMEFAAPVGSGDPNIVSDNFQLGIYAQDDWEITDRLTLNLGLRWDYERTPAYLDYVHDPAIAEFVAGRASYTAPNGTVTPPYMNLANANFDIDDFISTGKERKAFTGAWQPRIGFSYAFDADKRFVLFGGYGRSYDRTQFDFIQQELAQGLFANRTFNFNNPGDALNVCAPSATCIAWNPAYLTPEGRAALIAGLPVGAGRELRFINNDLKVPYSDQFSLGVRGNFNLLELEVGYSYVQSKDGFAYILGNRRPDGSFFPPSGNPDSPFGFGPAPFGSIILGTNGIETKANTAYFKLTKRYTQASPWSVDATYTFTDAEENRQLGEVFALDFPSIDDYPWITATGTRKHRFVIAATGDIPMGITLAGKFQIASPKYLAAFIHTAGTPPQRTIVSTKTAGNGDLWGYRQMDLSATKYVPIKFLSEEARLRFRIDIINLFNDYNFASFNATTGKRNPTAYNMEGPPRTIKLSAGFSF